MTRYETHDALWLVMKHKMRYDSLWNTWCVLARYETHGALWLVMKHTDKMGKIQRRATKMIPEIRHHSYHQWIQELDLISLVQRRLRGQLIEVFKYLNRFTTESARGLFDYDLNDRTRLIVKHFNTSVAQHFYPIKITTTWNSLPNEVVTSKTVISFKNSLDKQYAENPPNVRVNW